jgi:hypothetical protein
MKKYFVSSGKLCLAYCSPGTTNVDIKVGDIFYGTEGYLK